MGTGLQMQMPTGLGVRGLPQRLGEEHGPQDEPVSSVEATWKSGPSTARPSSRPGNPGEVEATVHSGTVSCVRTGPVPSAPCSPGPAPPALQRALLGPPGGAKQAPLPAASARWAVPPNMTESWGKSPPHTSQPSATHTLMLTTFQNDFLSVTQRSHCGPKPASRCVEFVPPGVFGKM